MIWGWTFVAMKVLVPHLSPIEIVGLRFSIGLPVLYGLIAWRRIPFGFVRGDLGPLAVGAAIIVVHFVAQPYALRSTSATNTGWIIAFSPLAIAILSALLLKERIGARVAVGIGAASAGIVLLVSKGDLASLSRFESVGDWIILGTSVTWALFTIVTRDLSRRRSPLVVTLFVFASACVFCLAWMAFDSDRADWGRIARLPPLAIAAILFLGVLGTLAQWFWQLGVARLGAARAGVYLYLEPVATTALAVPLFGEAFGIPTAIGGALVLAGVAFAQRGSAAS